MQPLANFWAINIIIVHPAFIPSIVGRVNINTLDLARVARQQCLKRMKVITLHNQVTAILATTIQFRNRFQKAIRHLFMMSDNGIFTDPVERGHGCSFFSSQITLSVEAVQSVTSIPSGNIGLHCLMKNARLLAGAFINVSQLSFTPITPTRSSRAACCSHRRSPAIRR